MTDDVISTKTVDYLIKKYLNEATNRDVFDWADTLLNNGYKTPALSAFVKVRESLSVTGIEDYVAKIFQELQWELPEKEQFLRWYIHWLSYQIVYGESEPTEAAKQIHQVIQNLEYSTDMRIWTDLTLNTATDFDDNTHLIHLKNRIIKTARKYLMALAGAPRRYGPSTDTKYMEKGELLRSGWRFLITSGILLGVMILVMFLGFNSTNPSMIVIGLLFMLTIGFMMTFGGGIYLLLRCFLRRKDYIFPIEQPKN